jgi:hypothetical protein
MANIFQNGTEESVEFRWFQVSGKRIIIDNNPFLIGIGTDITDRKKLEKSALKNSEDRIE